VTTGDVNEGQIIERQVDATMATTGVPIATVTADAGYAYAKVYGALIPTKAEPIKSAVPLRRFRYDARHDIVKCPRGKVLRPGRRIKHGRFFYARARDCSRCSLASLCLSKGRVNKALVIGDDYPALLRARRRRERWSDNDSASTSGIAGARRVFTARRRPGTVSPAPSAAASTTCASSPSSSPPRST
jgi:hypothetical protein